MFIVRIEDNAHTKFGGGFRNLRLSKDAKYLILRVDCELSREIHICISEITINIMKWALIDWLGGSYKLEFVKSMLRVLILSLC